MPLAGCRHMTRILVAEFLLANAEASRNASRSMLNEAAAMLTAVATDLALAPNTDVTVLLSPETDPSTATLPSVRFIYGDLRPETLQYILRGHTNQSPYDAVLLIAPECDGVLVSLLKSIQEQPAMQIRSLNLNWRLAEIFADKRATDSWLRQHRIATIPTKTVSDTLASLLQRAAASRERRGFSPPSECNVLGGLTPCRSPEYSHDFTGQFAVLKPRDGAGAGGVQVVPFVREKFEELQQQHSDDDKWLLQPYLQGVACSVGFIGGGPHGPTTILPPARQNIVTSGGRLSYQGGQIPCEPELVACIEPIAERLATAFGPFDGYVGVDLLVDLSVPTEAQASVRVVEVNPRLCTSYVGYRMLTVDNLATWILQQNTGHEIRWKSETIQFSTI